MTLDLEALGYNTHFSSQITEQERGLDVGRVAFGSRGLYQILLSPQNGVHAELLGALRKTAAGAAPDYPAVGDWVLIKPRDANRAMIVRALTRRNALVRREQSRREVGRRASTSQILAANVDWGLITSSLNEEWNARRLERYLGLVRESGAQPAFLLTKSDLAADGGSRALQETRALDARAPVLLLNAPAGLGLDALKELLQGKGTAAVLGSSGVGKSTLVNALLGHPMMPTAEIRSKDARGRHTTSGRHLIPLPQGGCLIDSPGLRDLGLVEDAAVSAGFEEIMELSTRCRFSDCRHSNEPGCAVIAALTRGTLSPARWNAYAKVRDETAAAGPDPNRRGNRMKRQP